MKAAAAGRINRIRDFSLHGLAATPGHREVGHSVEQHARVRVPWRTKELGARRHLNQSAKIHHANTVGHVADDRQIVADEEVGKPQFILEVAHEVKICA